MSIADRSN